jgi:ferredoxin
VYCGYCARYCPYDVLALEEVAALPAAAPGVTGSPLPAVSDSVSAPEATDAKR